MAKRLSPEDISLSITIRRQFKSLIEMYQMTHLVHACTYQQLSCALAASDIHSGPTIDAISQVLRRIPIT